MRVIEIREERAENLRHLLEDGIKLFSRVIRELDEQSNGQIGNREYEMRNYYGGREDNGSYNEMMGERRRDSYGRYR